jgi:hypothetical protein
VSRQKEVLPKAKMPPAARFSFQGKKKRWKEKTQSWVETHIYFGYPEPEGFK